MFLSAARGEGHMLVRGAGPGGEHVALPDRPHRRHAEHRAAAAHRADAARTASAQAGLECVTWRDRRPASRNAAPAATCSSSSARTRRPTGSSGCGVELDTHGFVLTGRACAQAGPAGQRGAARVERAGVFAVGDVRSGSVKRVGGAIGEGAAVVARSTSTWRASRTPDQGEAPSARRQRAANRAVTSP